jgi:hypothetical protein
MVRKHEIRLTDNIVGDHSEGTTQQMGPNVSRIDRRRSAVQIRTTQ